MKSLSEKHHGELYKIALAVIWSCLLIHTVQFIFIVVEFNSLRYNLQTHRTELIEVTLRPAAMYKGYLKQFMKDYDSAETKRRFQFFKESLKEISHLNQVTGAVHGLTKFSDMAKSEFPDTSSLNMGECIDKDINCFGQQNSFCKNFYPNKYLPEKFDWRDKHVVGPVLDQKQCNGCWAFGIVGVMESMAAINRVELDVRRSVQELIDCSTYNEKCDGGNVGKALKWLCHCKWGVVTEEEYPLKLINETCTINVDDTYEGLHIKQFCQFCKMQNVKEILRLIRFHGPVLAIVDAGPLRSYLDGVIQWSCVRSGNHDHVVQIVGYNMKADVPHFIIRNSWGEDFGIGGYFKLALEGNVCGVTDEITFFDIYEKPFEREFWRQREKNNCPDGLFS